MLARLNGLLGALEPGAQEVLITEEVRVVQGEDSEVEETATMVAVAKLEEDEAPRDEMADAEGEGEKGEGDRGGGAEVEERCRGRG